MKHFYTLTFNKILLFVVMFICTTLARGQSYDYNPNENDSNAIVHHEIGLSLYSPPNFEFLSTLVKLPHAKSIEYIYLLFWATYDTVGSDPDYVFSNTVSFFYKFHFKNHALRFAYASNSLSYKNVVDSTYWNSNISGWFRMYSGNYQMQKFSLGYEKNYTYKKFDLYYAIDLAYYWGSINGSALKGYGNPDANYTRNIDYTYNINLNEFSVAPTLGLRFRFWKVFAASAEINCNFLYCKAKDDSGRYPTYSRFHIYSNPISSAALSFYL